MSAEPLPFAASCERNKRPIFEAMQPWLPPAGEVLEIGSGTGQHVVFFAAHTLQLAWQPSEQAANLPGLERRLHAEAGSNIRSPIELDVLATWPQRRYAMVFSSNTSHIMGWPAVRAMFAGVSLVLEQGGVFCLYGPFNEGGRYTAPSNAAFDETLRRQDPEMGLRDVEALQGLAWEGGMRLVQQAHLPANNQLLVFLREGATTARNGAPSRRE